MAQATLFYHRGAQRLSRFDYSQGCAFSTPFANSQQLAEPHALQATGTEYHYLQFVIYGEYSQVAGWRC